MCQVLGVHLREWGGTETELGKNVRCLEKRESVCGGGEAEGAPEGVDAGESGKHIFAVAGL